MTLQGLERKIKNIIKKAEQCRKDYPMFEDLKYSIDEFSKEFVKDAYQYLTNQGFCLTDCEPYTYSNGNQQIQIYFKVYNHSVDISINSKYYESVLKEVQDG